MKFCYHNPVEIIFGVDTLGELDRILRGRRALLITTQGFWNRGLVEKLNGITSNIVQVINNVKPNPTFSYLKHLYESVTFDEFDVIIALGGGSVIDSAKALSVYNDGYSFEFVEDIIRYGSNCKYKLKPIIAIPTTAGTGSEVTPWATIWDEEEKKKYSLYLKDLWVESCIVDPKLTVSLPKNVTIETSLDALSHGLESIWNKKYNPISTRNAIEACKIIVDTLPLAVNNLENLEYREKLMFAALKAGLAFSNTETAIAHAISYYITINKGISHGLACSFVLPDIIDVVCYTNDDIDYALKEIFGELSSKKIRTLYNELNITTDIKNYGVCYEEIEELKSSVYKTTRIQNSLVNIDKLFEKIKQIN